MGRSSPWSGSTAYKVSLLFVVHLILEMNHNLYDVYVWEYYINVYNLHANYSGTWFKRLAIVIKELLSTLGASGKKKISTKKKIDKQPIPAFIRIKWNSTPWLAAWRFSFWYWTCRWGWQWADVQAWSDVEDAGAIPSVKIGKAGKGRL